MFRTEIIPQPSDINISLKDVVYMIGSCFTENIGRKFRAYKFDIQTSPFGIIYNPYSIFKLLKNSLSENLDDTGGIIENQGIFRHFDAHSDISATTRQELEKKLIDAYAQSRKKLLKAKVLIVTLGTSIVFKHNKYNDIVANCHKIPSPEFEERLLTPDEILDSFDRFYRKLTTINKDVKIIFTVSPVRHVRSTLIRNSVSKSILRLAVHLLCDNYSHIEYFPSYEIILDDLRDYRFFKPDLVHPDEVAVDYVWEKFKNVYFDEETRKFIVEWDKIIKAVSHKPFNPASREHQQFIDNTITRLRQFEGRVDISEELKILEDQRL